MSAPGCAAATVGAEDAVSADAADARSVLVGSHPPHRRRGPAPVDLGWADRSPDTLEIAGLTPMSTCDWPGRLVATVFLQGCPWRCTYCHNQAILDPRTPGVLPWSDVTALLARRHGLLDGVVFSGGEPTRQAALADACRAVRDAGFLVGLHTSGAYPNRLAAVLPYVDWVGFDVKAPARLYREITRVGGATTTADAAFTSLRLLLDTAAARPLDGPPLDVQVRTTVDPTVLTPADVADLTAVLAGIGVEDHVLQEARPDGTTTEYRHALAAVRAREAAR
ncbi:anaerobic ribonucleoside-triphosphate reductase activating protein [Cellulomonas alba]|uniref:Anaerobic ribonucleoside-triphosphate reductase activating protein n=1 Tax=Cellulomonas alba TaxID=3053467 RepID=A0ABT7SG26_9CELL|nr:anaerobic ribonucleoside-triphosphate reductase activating protein [Cellulomonas alba]MDM7854459.1 anaerobic ribonucleoside-triphosphate reductase activating protein [Cellulomonas alba]